MPDLPQPVEAPAGDFSRDEDIVFDKLAPYVFSECARDYGAIHTDRKVAESAGLPGMIMHGTGTFARVLSAIVNAEGNGEPDRIAGFSGSLSAMVCCPSTTVLKTAMADNGVRFELRNEDDEAAIRNGMVWFR
ncbi:MaoC/PaaZ C-terminal domain-containing protein [Brevibacterium sp. FAM 25378]|uniref:MaoC/PaaZ C-terminal domain-containing protein n=1 Tax=unclassified Brevibacterium TaxID=2614124 RepID=UPI001F0E8D44|nr:MaoC/PaaZ C-terminal domain-containing protein [Brevibacterium sp. S22]